MDAAALVAQLAARGIELRLDGDRVLVHGERRLLTRELQLQLSAQKQAILAHLKAQHESRTGSADAPLSYAQQRLWFLDQMQPGQAAYTLGMAERLHGPLDVQALQTALTNLVARHEILRTTFPAVDGQPVQRVAPPYPVELPVIDLSSLSASEQDARVVQQVEAQLARPFDLASDRLLRAMLLRLGDASHVFALSVHHTIGDGWSVAIVGHELAELYAAAVQHRAAVLPPVERQYRDYAIGQAEWMRSSAPAQEVRHWTNVLHDVPRVLALPGDRARPALAGSRGGRVEFTVDAVLAASLRTLSRQHGSTLFMTLLGAFGVLLGRHAALPLLAIATPIAGRHREQDATLIGCLVNTLPLVVDLRGEPSFVELLARVRDVTLDAYDHQDLPFERLVEELHPERDLSRNPIVQVSFGLHNAPGQTPYASLPLHGLEATPLDVAASTVRFDVELDVWEVDGGLHCRLLYARELFDAAAMQSFAAQFTTLLQGIAADPTLPVSRIPLLSAERRDAVIAHGQRAFRGAPASPPAGAAASRRRSTEAQARDACEPAGGTPAFLGNPDTTLLHELVFAQAARTPDAIAIVCGRDSLTYGELAQRARDLADRLRDAGVVADTPVALCVDRSLHTVPAMLAILDAGGAYVPIDPDHPAERIDLVLSDCAATIVVTESALADRFANRNITIIYADQMARVGGGTTAIHPDGETLAYLMYTSGSTGRPKGVEVPHRAVTGMLRAVNEVIALSREDVFLAVTTIAFDISVLELFLPLINGAQLVLATREEVVDGARLIAALDRHAVTMMQATPATWRLLLASDWSGHRRLTLLCGGEALPPALAAELLPRCESVLNLYGPTETTIWSSVDRVFASEPITIGGPLSNSTLYILDQHLEPVPPGVAGELWIGGSGVTRGYHARPDLTFERYLPDPFSVVRGARIYRTGDLARQRADGRIECLGRVDQQVKLRGFRIEPGEIEAALLAHAGAREAVVVLHSASPDEQRLVAYVVPAEVDATADAVRDALRTRLPAYLIPSDVVLLHELPRTPNGKLDRASLPSPMRAIPNERITPPGSDAERVIAEIWSAVLNVPQVGVRDNFFDLGGHSLLMMRVRAQIAERLGVELPVVDLFRLPTIRAVAEHIAGTTAATTVVDADVVAARQLAAIGRFAHAAQGREQER